METTDYDICIIGAGPSGFAAAMRAWDFGKNVCLVERANLGGAGVWAGALTSKTLWELSRDYLNVLQRDRGFLVDSVRLDYPSVIHCVEQAVDEKVSQMRQQLEELANSNSEHTGRITLERGNARFHDAHTIIVEDSERDLQKFIKADNFIIATGSRPRELEHIHVDGHRIMTSDHIMRAKDFPKSLVILGAGVIGCEFATIFSNFGHTKVYLIDRADRILPFEDDDIANVCAKNFEKRGVTIHHRAKLISMEVIDDHVEYTIEHPSGGRETIQVDHALISVGRVPNTDNLGLEGIGVNQDERGFILHNDGQTSVPHIYAVGDVTLDIALVNVGEIEGRHVAQRICEGVEQPLSYENLSTIIFVNPEIAGIGMNERMAHEKKLSYRVASYGYGLVNRAIAMRATEGFVKVIVSDDEKQTMLGMRALGVHASTMIEAASLIIQSGRPASDLGDLLHPHPAMTEALQECVRMINGTSIYKPQVFKSDLRLSRISF